MKITEYRAKSPKKPKGINEMATNASIGERRKKGRTRARKMSCTRGTSKIERQQQQQQSKAAAAKNMDNNERCGKQEDNLVAK